MGDLEAKKVFVLKFSCSVSWFRMHLPKGLKRTLSPAARPPLFAGNKRRGTSYEGYKTALSEVKTISNDELGKYLADGYQMVDVRPTYERERIYPEGRCLPLTQSPSSASLFPLALFVCAI